MLEPDITLYVGQIFGMYNRIFKISTLQMCWDGTPVLTAECLTPIEEDCGKVWWCIHVNDLEALELYTVH